MACPLASIMGNRIYINFGEVVDLMVHPLASIAGIIHNQLFTSRKETYNASISDYIPFVFGEGFYALLYL